MRATKRGSFLNNVQIHFFSVILKDVNLHASRFNKVVAFWSSPDYRSTVTEQLSGRTNQDLERFGSIICPARVLSVGPQGNRNTMSPA